MTNTEMSYIAFANISGIALSVISNQRGVLKIIFKKLKGPEKSELTTLHPDDPFMFNIFPQLEEYFAHRRKTFNVPLDIRGTEFQKKVWEELMKIPYGKTVSYKYISKQIGDEKAIRAIGKANGSNPIPIVIPCHRVINSDGSLGGYSGGLDIKEKLLKLEGSLEAELFD